VDGDTERWRGWAAAEPGQAVTSTRLVGTEASVQNRLFPKVRSWFALGAPLELLSPLSVIRIVYLVLGATVPLAAWAGDAPIVPVAGLVAVTLVVVAWLLRARDLGPRACHLLAVLGVAVVATLVLLGHADAAVVPVTLLLVPLSVFAGLFFRLRAILRLQAFQVVALGLSALDAGVGVAALVAGVGVLATGTAALTVALTTRSARRQTTIDPDTGLPNGYGLAGLLADHERFALATVVLRGLAEAREALGYRAGTELLRRAVEDLGQVLPPQCLIGRVDGDELVVAQPTDAGGAVELAHLLTDGIGSGRYLVGGVEVMLRAHVGLAVAPDDGHDVNELLRRASLSARRALGSGIVLERWNGATGAMTAADLTLLSDLRSAAEKGELWVAYQPQIAPAGGETTAVEALLRWTSPTHGAISPGDFIPLAERTGLVDRLTDWVLGEVLDAQVRWRAAGLHLRTSVNLSAMSLSDPTLPGRILDEVRRRGLTTSCLAVEVTETVALDVSQAVDRLRPLHDEGVWVSIDDFGSGYTSLSVLPRLPLDELKVDQRFVLASPTSAADMAIVESVRDLARRLGLEAVAEGVETEEISRRMRELGFDALQGYHFARPMPEPALVEFVSSGAHPALRRPPETVLS
jgi:predicted signal transduction protein with EAL and GGDEF domain